MNPLSENRDSVLVSDTLYNLLQPLLKDEEDIVQGAVLKSLAYLGTSMHNSDTIIELLKSYLDVSVTNIDAAFGLGIVSTSLSDSSSILKLLLSYLETGSKWYEIVGIIEGIGILASSIPNPMSIVEVISPFLNESNDDIRGKCALSLGLIATQIQDSSHIIRLLEPHLDDSSEFVRELAVVGVGLAAINSPDSTKIVKKLYRTDYKVQDCAGASLGLIGAISKDTSSIFKKLTKFDSGIGIGILGLNHSDPKQVLDILENYCKSGSKSHEKGSVIGLGILANILPDSTRVIDLLSQKLESPSVEVRKSVSIGLGLASLNLRDPYTIVETLKPHLVDLNSNSGSIAGLGIIAGCFTDASVIIENLYPYLNDSYWRNRVSAIAGLGLVLRPKTKIALAMGLCDCLSWAEIGYGLSIIVGFTAAGLILRTTNIDSISEQTKMKAITLSNIPSTQLDSDIKPSKEMNFENLDELVKHLTTKLELNDCIEIAKQMPVRDADTKVQRGYKINFQPHKDSSCNQKEVYDIVQKIISKIRTRDGLSITLLPTLEIVIFQW